MKTKLIVISAVTIVVIIALTSCKTSTESKNEPSVISSLTANPETVGIEETSILICDATDPNGDNLTYIWEASSGSIGGTGSSVNWIAPNSEGSYSISCKVDDGNGGKDNKSINVAVTTIPSGQLKITSTDGNWKSKGLVLTNNWYRDDFDDSGWNTSQSPWSNTPGSPVSSFTSMWDPSVAELVVFRRVFNLTDDPSSATLKISADNIYLVFTNDYAVGA